MKRCVEPRSVTWSVLRSTRIAQRGESGRLAGACLCLKSNYVGRITSLPSDGTGGYVYRPTTEYLAIRFVCFPYRSPAVRQHDSSIVGVHFRGVGRDGVMENVVDGELEVEVEQYNCDNRGRATSPHGSAYDFSCDGRESCFRGMQDALRPWENKGG